MALSARQQGYDTRWEKARAHFLAEHPLCAMCLASGRVAAAKAVDHIIPHKGDKVLFWRRSNWQSLCATHHNSSKQRAEKLGVLEIGCDKDGFPIDPTHPWNNAS